MKVNGGNQGPIRPDRVPDAKGPHALPIGEPDRSRDAKGPHALPIGEPDRSRDAKGPRALPIGPPRLETPSQIDKRDRVEISDAGRARANKLERLAHADPERFAEIRRRILSGAYEADEVVAEVARRLLERGDI